MKKIIVGTLVAGCMLVASDKTVSFESKLFDLNKVKNEEMKGFLVGIELSFPSIAKVVKDYYEAKTCSKEFYNEVTMDDVKEFVSTSPAYGVLYGLSAIGDDTSKLAYNQLVSDYEFINCGKGTLSNPDKYSLKGIEDGSKK